MKEKCILCGKETNEEMTTDINFRIYYVEGSGQLCKKCYDKIYNKEYSMKTTKGIRLDT
jgi:hypothetical protein